MSCSFLWHYPMNLNMSELPFFTHPFPKMEIVVAKLLSEETQFAILNSKHPATTTDTFLITFSHQFSYRCCHWNGHENLVCTILKNKNNRIHLTRS